MNRLKFVENHSFYHLFFMLLRQHFQISLSFSIDEFLKYIRIDLSIQINHLFLQKYDISLKCAISIVRKLFIIVYFSFF